MEGWLPWVWWRWGSRGGLGALPGAGSCSYRAVLHSKDVRHAVRHVVRLVSEPGTHVALGSKSKSTLFATEPPVNV